MSNNFWNHQQNGIISPQNNDNASHSSNGSTRTGSLLRDYRQQQQGPQQHSPALMPPTQDSPLNPPQIPPAQLPQRQPQGWPSPQSWPTGNRRDGQGWVANTMQMVRRWSGRVAAVAPPVDPNPLVLYRPNAPLPATEKHKPWKRSRTVRIAMQMKHRRARWQQRRPRTQAIVSGILIALLLLLLIGASSGSAYAYKYYQDQLPQLQSLANQQISQTTRIYDRNGVLLFDAYASSGRRTPVSYDYLPQVLKDAQTSAEDPTFWTNSGIDPQGILRAGGQYLQAGGRTVSGGSTMTQQLIKNMTGDAAVTLNRKIPEATLAIGLTQQYPKTKIMEMYFNVSAYGALNDGVEAAVEDYFHLNPQCDNNFKCIPGVYYLSCSDASHLQKCDPTQCDTAHNCDPILGLARASLLAGMPQSPSSYDPTQGIVDPDTGVLYYLERQQYVLNQMLKYNINIPGLGPITQDMANQVETMTAKMKFPPYQHSYYHGAQHFVQWVIQQLEGELGVQTFLNGGFNIRTTIDINLEHYVERAVQRHLYQPEQQYFGYGNGPLDKVNNVNNAAVVVMDAKTGEVLAMDGSANFNDRRPVVNGNFNSALSPLQPGSTIKPIVYAAAFQQGWYPGMVVPDYKTYFPNNGVTDAKSAFVPGDYGGQYSNTNTTVRVATADSRNVPAVKASLFAGVTNVVSTAQRFGITTLSQKADNNTSFALGTSGIPLIQMVGAYQVFANQGVRIPPKSVLDIYDNYGHHLYHFDPAHPGGTQVLSPQIAFLMTSVLSDEKARKVEFWPDHDLSFWSPGSSGQPDALYPDVAAKTGTTDGFKDNWTIGYTSSAVVGVWAGNANGDLMKNVIGITGAAPIWHSVMTYVSGMCGTFTSYDNIPCGKQDLVLKPRTFTPPSGVVQQCVSPSNGLAGASSSNCDYMLTNEVPQQTGVTAPSNNPTPTPTPQG